MTKKKKKMMKGKMKSDIKVEGSGEIKSNIKVEGSGEMKR